MQLRFAHILTTGLLLASGLCSLLPATALADTKGKIEAKQAQLEEVRERIQDVSEDMAEGRQSQNQLQAKLRESEEQIARLSKAVAALDGQVSQREQSVAQHARERAKAMARLEKQRQALRVEILASFKHGTQRKLKLLLNQQDPTRIGRMLTYYQYLSRAHSQRIAGITQQVSELRKVEQQINTELAALNSKRTERTDALAKLHSTRNERKRQLLAISQQLDKSGGALTSLKQQQASLSRLLESLKRHLRDIPAEFNGITRFSRSRGKLPWPVHGKLLAQYGHLKHGSRFRWHGIWIAAKTGTPVRAVANGRVVYIGWMQRLGLIVVLQHEDGYYSIYGHNQSIRVDAGARVQAGDIIASVGNSGGHRRSGLYFEIRRGSKPQNPKRWLSRS